MLINGKDEAKVADLGLARDAGSPADISGNMTMMAGTPKWEVCSSCPLLSCPLLSRPMSPLPLSPLPAPPPCPLLSSPVYPLLSSPHFSFPHSQAPEVLVAKKGKNKYTAAADVYGFGMVLFEMVAGHEPFPEIQDMFELKKTVVDKHKRPKVPKSTPSGLASLMKACWHKDPPKRPSFAEVLQAIEKIQDKNVL